MRQAYVQRSRPIRNPKASQGLPLRRLLQVFFLVLTLWIGLQFAVFVHQLEAQRAPTISRPPGIEAFLPISALVSLKYWIVSGAISRIHPAALALLLTFGAMALLIKRGFCSWVCPIGLASEVLAFAGGRAFKRKVRLPKPLDFTLRAPKYLLLGFFIWAIFVNMDALEIQSFLDSPYHRIADIKMLKFFEHPSQATLGTIGFLVVLSFVLPHVFCRYLCPYGALLGLLSLLSPFKVRRNGGLCTGCKRCTLTCPAGIQVHKKKAVVSQECHACLECVRACPTKGALLFSTTKKRLALSMKACALLIILLVALGVTSARLLGVWQSAIPLSEYRNHIGRLASPPTSTTGEA